MHKLDSAKASVKIQKKRDRNASPRLIDSFLLCCTGCDSPSGSQTQVRWPAAQHQGMQRYRDSAQQNAKYEYSLPPSPRHQQGIGQGDEDRAGESCYEGEESQWPGPVCSRTSWR